MKRLTALLLALLIVCGAVPATAATLIEKFEGQLREQGFKGTVTLTAEGENTAAMSQDDWNWLKAAAPRITAEINHSFYNKSDGEATLNLLVDGQPAGKTTLLYDASLMGLTSDFLSGHQEAWYTAARDWNLSFFLQGLTQQGSQWPAVWRMLLAVENAPAAWKDRAAQHLVPLETRLGAWLNGFVTPSSGTEGDTVYTQLRWVIPVSAVKEECKQLLADLYADGALLSLLREIVTPQEAASYLQPGMEPIFDQWIDRLALNGEIEITRRYNTLGESMLDEVILPFAESQQLKSLAITATPQEGGRLWHLAGAARSGASFGVTCLAAEGEQIYSGSVTLLPPADPQENAAAAEAPRAVRFDYNCTWDGGKEAYSLSTDKFEQTVTGSLVIKPGEEGKPAQSLALKAAFSSGSSQRSSTHLDAELTWRDLDGDTSVTATLSSRTAAPKETARLADQKNAVRIDLMSPGEYEGLLKEWQAHASAWLMDVMELLLPTALTDE